MTLKTVALAAGLSLAGIAAAQADGHEPPNGVPNGPTGYSEHILQLDTARPHVDQRRHDRRAVPYGQNHTKTGNRAYLNGFTTYEVLDGIR